MARTNYSFEKRQRELAKKRKKEEKAARKASGGGDEAAEMTPNEAALIDLPADAAAAGEDASEAEGAAANGDRAAS